MSHVIQPKKSVKKKKEKSVNNAVNRHRQGSLVCEHKIIHLVIIQVVVVVVLQVLQVLQVIQSVAASIKKKKDEP